MASESSPVDYNLPFSKRNGIVPLPEPMRLEEISNALRRELWYAIGSSFDTAKNFRGTREDSRYLIRESDWGKLYTKIKMLHFNLAHDKIAFSKGRSLEFLRKIIIEGDYYLVFDVIETIVTEYYPLRQRIIECFDEFNAPYRVVAHNDPEARKTYWIVEAIGSKQEGAAVDQSIRDLESVGMKKAIEHLNKAAIHISKKEFSDSVADSVNAVESVAVTIASLPNGTLSGALKILENKKIITHAALTKILKGVYGYASDEGGIRHADHEGKSPNVGIDEALLMFGTCASLAGFLARKKDKIQSS